jgi:predicted PurR-regulated permease PerM
VVPSSVQRPGGDSAAGHFAGWVRHYVFLQRPAGTLLVSIVLAYLLEWPTVRLERIGFSRTWATSVVLILFVGILLLMAFVVMPVAWQQGIYLIRDMPGC